MLLYFSFNFRICLAASTLLHGHIALATLSPLETDPQILERWSYGHKVHVDKKIRPKDIGLEFLRDVQ